MRMLPLLGSLAAVAALFGWISSRVLRLPATIGTMLLTAASSLALVGLSVIVPGLHTWTLRMVREIDFERLILHGMLSTLLFAGAFLLDLKYLSKEKLAVGLLAVLGTLASMLGVAVLTWRIAPLAGISASLLVCLLFGALISPTDPIAVLELLRRVQTPKNIEAQLAGESLFNDGVAAVLFLALLEAVRGASPSALQIGGMLLLKAGGGLLLGVLLAIPVSFLMHTVREYQIEILLTLALALGGYAIADAIHISAPLEAVAAGIALRRINISHPPASISHEELNRFWAAVDEIQNSVLFVLLGCELLVVSFDSHSMLLGGVSIVIVNVVRILSVALIIGLLKLVQPGHASSTIILSWGGLRGGLSIALALSVPNSAGKQWILAATYIIVSFSIVIQGGTMDLYLRRFSPKLLADSKM